MNGFSSVESCASRVASGCSAAIAMNVTPMIVSARVVYTRRNFLSPSSVYGKPKFTPKLLPIQFSWISRTRSDHPGSLFCVQSSSSSA